MVPFVPLLGLDESELDRVLRRPGSCDIVIRGDVGCTLMSCCAPLARQQVAGTCGRVRSGGSRWLVGAIIVDGRVVQASAIPEHPVDAEVWLGDSVRVRRVGDDALHLLKDGTVVRTADDDAAVVRVEFVDQALPDQQVACRNPLQRPPEVLHVPFVRRSAADGALILPGDSVGAELPVGE